ncbi:MAG: type II toxin-antitoxin system HicA family toxin [Phycisphaerae bacterium]
MKPISGKRFCRLLEDRGWILKRINGSHHIYANLCQGRYKCPHLRADSAHPS